MNILQALWAAIQCKPIPPRRRNRNSAGASNSARLRNIAGLGGGTPTGNPSARENETDTRPALSTSLSSDRRISLCTVDSTMVDTVGETHYVFLLESGLSESDATPRSSFSSGSLMPSVTPTTSDNFVISPYCSSINVPGPVLLESIIEKGVSVDRGEVDCDKSEPDQHMSIALDENFCSAADEDEEIIGMPLKDED